MKMKFQGILQRFLSDHNPQHQQGSSNHLIFSGNKANVIKNGETLLEERISLFDGRTNPIRCFSVDDLNSMKVDRLIGRFGFHTSYAGVWDEKLVLIKKFGDTQSRILVCREIAVATQMGTHRNVHRILGCCLDTKYPVLVYQWEDNGTLNDRIMDYKERTKDPLEWKDRLRIAWEIAHAVAYMHTAFRRPIIHRDVKPLNIYLDQNDSARLSDFSMSISIPEGKKHIEDCPMGTMGYVAPEYMSSGKLAESADVFSFGALLLVLLTGKSAVFTAESDRGQVRLVDWVSECRAANCLGDIVDPAISTNGALADENFERQLKALVELAVRCSAEDEECRPTMVDVATQLKNMIMSSSHSL